MRVLVKVWGLGLADPSLLQEYSWSEALARMELHDAANEGAMAHVLDSLLTNELMAFPECRIDLTCDGKVWGMGEIAFQHMRDYPVRRFRYMETRTGLRWVEMPVRLGDEYQYPDWLDVQAYHREKG